MAVRQEAQHTIAVVLGASAFPEKDTLGGGSAFAASAGAFVQCLEAQFGKGWADTCLLDLFDDEGSSLAQNEAIGEFCRRHRDAERLILYYVGHGGFQANQQYGLVLHGTKAGYEHLTSLRSGDLATTLDKQFPGGKVYLILDCCFAAEAVQDFQADGGLARAMEVRTFESFRASGTALLCASSRRDFAVSKGGDGRTMFSGSLVDVLRAGVPDKGEFLSFEDVHAAVEARIRTRFGAEGVRPEIHSPRQLGADVARLPLFANPAYEPPSLEDLAPELWAALTGERAFVRKATAEMLEQLKHEARPDLVVAADRALWERFKLERDTEVIKAIGAALGESKEAVLAEIGRRLYAGETDQRTQAVEPVRQAEEAQRKAQEEAVWRGAEEERQRQQEVAWHAAEEKRRQQVVEAEQRAEEVRQRGAAEAKRKAEEERQRQAAEPKREAEEERQRQAAEAKRKADEEERQREAAEAKRKAEEERQRQADGAKRKAEEERQRQAAEVKRKAEEERERQAAEAKRKAEEERQRVAAEAKRKAEEERQRQAAEAKRKAEEERQRQAAEAKRKAAEEERKAAEEERERQAAEAKRKAEEERQRGAAEAKRKAEEERQRQAAEAKRKADEERQRQAAEAKRKAEDERQRQAAEAKRKAEDECQRQAAEAKRKADEERQRQATEAKRKAEKERRRQAAEAKRKADEEERQHQAAEAKRKAEKERRRQAAEAKRKAEEERQRQAAEAKRKAEANRKAKARERRRHQVTWRREGPARLKRNQTGASSPGAAAAPKQTEAAPELSLSLAELGLGSRLVTLLDDEGFHRAGDLVEHDAMDLLAIRGIGPGSLGEINEALRAHGLSLAKPDGSAAVPGPAKPPLARPGPKPASAPAKAQTPITIGDCFGVLLLAGLGGALLGLEMALLREVFGSWLFHSAEGYGVVAGAWAATVAVVVRPFLDGWDEWLGVAVIGGLVFGGLGFVAAIFFRDFVLELGAGWWVGGAVGGALYIGLPWFGLMFVGWMFGSDKT